MPTTDAFGQGYTALDYGDVPDLKIMGDGLLKMAGQTVMRFTTATARNAGIAAPVAGMLAWLNSEKQLTVYDGTAWTVIGAGTQSWTTVPIASGWSQLSSDNNDQGPFQYRVVNLFGEQTIMFRGGIAKTSYPGSVPSSWTLTATPLPTSARPTNKRTLVVPCSDINSDRITLKLDVQTDGHLSLWGTGNTNRPPWIGFNGCFASL